LDEVSANVPEYDVGKKARIATKLLKSVLKVELVADT
jgi:hypothetical protein